MALAEQADGKILVGGWFTVLGGQSRTCLGRLNADGTLDTTFDQQPDGYVPAIALQADGKILVVGGFNSLGGQTRNHIGRLNANGTLDTSFNPGADADVYSLALQADGKILVGGQFITLGGQSRDGIGRLNANGTLDAGFNPGQNGFVYSLALQADGKILVGGSFYTLGGQGRENIGRLNANGTLDTGFNPGASAVYGVFCLAVQADGKILVGGDFSALGGQSCTNIGRLNANGTLDTSFSPGEANALRLHPVYSLGVQTDGKILVGGEFGTLGGQSRANIGRLNADGTPDTTFNPGADEYVRSLAAQADGKILVGGQFRTLGGQSRLKIGRLHNTGPATQSLSFDGSNLTWRRGGASPEVWRTTFEYSPNGNSWTSLGAGIRVPGGWQLTGLALPTSTIFRARGYTVGGWHNSSGWYVESFLGPLTTNQPSLSVSPSGGLPLLSISGDLGRPYALEFVPTLASSNSWQPLTTLLLTNNPQTVLDPSAIYAPQRFYRARLNQ